MGSLLSRLSELWKEEEASVAMLGLDAAGITKHKFINKQKGYLNMLFNFTENN